MAFCRSLAPEAIVPEPGFSCFKIAINFRVSSPINREDSISSKERGMRRGRKRGREEEGEGGRKKGREGGRRGGMDGE